MADGEGVWSWRPDAGAKFLRSKPLRDDGGKRARSPGRARISRKTIAWGMPDVSGASAVNTRVHTPTTKRTRGCGCIGHPAFPAPSFNFEGDACSNSSANSRRENADACPLGCLKLESGIASDDTCGHSAKRSTAPQERMDCFVASAPRNDGGMLTSRLPEVGKDFLHVIASAAKQSISPRKEGMDCFVAKVPRK